MEFKKLLSPEQLAQVLELESVSKQLEQFYGVESFYQKVFGKVHRVTVDFRLNTLLPAQDRYNELADRVSNSGALDPLWSLV